MRIDDILVHGSFSLDGRHYTVLRFENGMSVCEREDGEIVYLAGHEVIDHGESVRSWIYQFMAKAGSILP